jgi:hypothetical protein
MAEPRDVFFIPSVINTGNVPWSYYHIRSAHIPDKRYEQTLKTIQTIRDKVPNVFIILIECSDISPEMTDNLRSKVDHFVQAYTDENVRKVCIDGSAKGHGETVQSILAIEVIKTLTFPIKRIFKISGRYYLNELFDINNFSLTTYTFNKRFIVGGEHHTVLYSVPFELFDHYNQVFRECLEVYKTQIAHFEGLFPPKCIPASYISCVGVAGYPASSNELWSPGPHSVINDS